MKQPRPAGAARDAAIDVERQAYRERLEVFLASRDAGAAATGDALQAGATVDALVEAAAGLARFAEEAHAVIKEEYRPRLHCRDNCWYCCCKPNVLVSIPELVRILDHVASAFAPDEAAALRERAERYAAQTKGRRLEDPVNESVPCPLLVEGRCSVYEIRPLVCRGYNSTDVEACRRAHADANVLVPIFAMLRDVTDGATVGACQRLSAAGLNDAVVDLGTALHRALSAGPDAARSILENAVDLQPGENRTYVGELWARVCETARDAGVDVRRD